MEDQLIQAYYWLSSAIAQAFAALIALTAMFYIYRMGKLRDQRKEIVKNLRSMIPILRAGSVKEGEKDRTLIYWNALVANLSDIKAVSMLINLLKETQDDKLKPVAWDDLDYYHTVEKRESKLKASITLPILLSALAMAFGILALVIGPKLCSDGWRWGIMGGESLLAAVALGWTVYVVIRMLKEPEEPKGEKEEK